MLDSRIAPVNKFYEKCVTVFHAEAARQGVAATGPIIIPELIPYGERILLVFLQDPFFETEFPDPRMYYYAIMSLGIQSGIVFASTWHDDFSQLDRQFDKVSAFGPSDYANELLQKHFPRSISRNQGNSFYQKIFEKFTEMHEPYWKFLDPRQYTFKALLAAYQLGVSMMLERLNYSGQGSMPSKTAQNANYGIMLTSCGQRVNSVTRLVSSVIDSSFEEASAYVAAVPTAILEGISYNEAEKIKRRFSSIGAKAEIYEVSASENE